MGEPTAGAMRAAEVVYNVFISSHALAWREARARTSIVKTAHLIDAETALPDLIAACEAMLKAFRQRNWVVVDGLTGGAAYKAQTALDKAKGEADV